MLYLTLPNIFFTVKDFSLIYRIVSIYLSSYYQKKTNKFDLCARQYILTRKYSSFGRIRGFGAIYINVSFVFTKSWKWNTPRAPIKTSMGHFIHQIKFKLSLDIQMYQNFPYYFWVLWSLTYP